MEEWIPRLTTITRNKQQPLISGGIRYCPRSAVSQPKPAKHWFAARTKKYSQHMNLTGDSSDPACVYTVGEKSCDKGGGGGHTQKQECQHYILDTQNTNINSKKLSIIKFTATLSTEQDDYITACFSAQQPGRICTTPN